MDLGELENEYIYRMAERQEVGRERGSRERYIEGR